MAASTDAVDAAPGAPRSHRWRWLVVAACLLLGLAAPMLYLVGLRLNLTMAAVAAPNATSSPEQSWRIAEHGNP